MEGLLRQPLLNIAPVNRGNNGVAGDARAFAGRAIFSLPMLNTVRVSNDKERSFPIGALLSFCLSICENVFAFS